MEMNVVEIKSCERNSFQYSHDCIIKNAPQHRSQGSGILFPCQAYKVSRSDMSNGTIGQLIRGFINFHLFPKVYASNTSNNFGGGLSETQTATFTSSSETPIPGPHSYEALARAYIAKESGMDRVRVLFQKDHTGGSGTQMMCMKIAVFQAFLSSFVFKYVVTWKFEREEFIRQHNATAFRTRIAAVRQMRDHLSVKSTIEGLKFATKLTTFSTGLILISQVIAAYRNKTSVIEYTAGAGITGAIARIHMGLRGMLVGSVVGSVLGTMVGLVPYVVLHAAGMTQDVMHMQDIIAKLKVERSITGDNVFKQKMNELMNSTEQAQTNS